MSTPAVSRDAKWSAAVAEAAAWIALLHGPDRSPASERGLQRWLAEDPQHARAFELATDTWNKARASVKRGAKVRLLVPGEADSTQPRSRRVIGLAAAAAIIISIVSGALFFLMPRDITTGVGERRILTLEDGTQVTLNTASRLVVEYDEQRRHVRLQSGEAYFDVATAKDRPFVVTAGERDVTALGTEFLVRHEGEQVAVTLMKGKVAVTPAASKPVRLDAPSADTTILAPGERVTFMARSSARALDRPELGKLTAWQQGRVHMDNLTLAQAAAEMNRYSAVQIAVEGPQASGLRLSGVFRIGDSRSFANAVAQTHGLSLAEKHGRLVLSGVPGSPAAEY